MPKNTTRPAAGSKPSSTKAKGDEVLNASDLIELIMEPLAAQTDRARLDILSRIEKLDDSVTSIGTALFKKVQAIDDSIEILANQKARDLREAPRIAKTK